jgi:DNA-binding Xre family transcriptional regulator
LIVVRLKEAMERYRARTGLPLTYQALADKTGIARATIESLASRSAYNTSLRTVAKLCLALDCAPGDLLELRVRADARRRKRKLA